MSYVGLAVLIGALVLFGVWYGQRQVPSQMPGEMMSQDEIGSVQSHRDFIIRGDWPNSIIEVSKPAHYDFWVLDDLGQEIREFATTHEKIMHVIVVRHDLTQFQHLHPEFEAASGRFTLPELTFAEPGAYRIFHDFAPAAVQRDAHGQPLSVVEFSDIFVEGHKPDASDAKVDTQQRTFVTDGYTFTLATVPTSPRSGETVRLRFTLRSEQVITNLEPYLGALGHVVVLRQGDLEFLHTHPVTEKQAPDGVVEFEVTFPRAGTYKIFGQFQHGGKVLTSEFGVAVEQGTASGTRQDMMEH